MKLAIMSDCHDRWDYLQKAIKMAIDEDCSHLLFAGDFISPPGVEVLAKFPGLIILVWGNNEGEKLGMMAQINKHSHMTMAGETYEGTIEGVRIFMNHYHRPAEIAANSGLFDLVIFGHTHVYKEEQSAHCVLINPGEIQGFRTGSSSFVIFETNSKQCRKLIIT